MTEHSHHRGHHHCHHQSNVDSHDGQKTVEQQNQQHFDSVASHVFKQEWIVQLSAQIFEEIQSNFDWLGVERRDRMLDYACGDGLASRALAPYMEAITGMDLSSRMVGEYNKRFAEEGFPTDKAHATQGNVLVDNGEPSSPPLVEGFDLIVMSMGLHHAEDPPRVIQELGKKLRSGGVLLVIEWLATPQGDTFSAKNPLKHIISKPGFSVKEMEEYFTKARLSDAQARSFKNRSEMPTEYGSFQTLFLARAKKP